MGNPLDFSEHLISSNVYPIVLTVVIFINKIIAACSISKTGYFRTTNLVEVKVKLKATIVKDKIKGYIYFNYVNHNEK